MHLQTPRAEAEQRLIEIIQETTPIWGKRNNPSVWSWKEDKKFAMVI